MTKIAVASNMPPGMKISMRIVISLAMSAIMFVSKSCDSMLVSLVAWIDWSGARSIIDRRVAGRLTIESVADAVVAPRSAALVSMRGKCRTNGDRQKDGRCYVRTRLLEELSTRTLHCRLLVGVEEEKITMRTILSFPPFAVKPRFKIHFSG